MVVRKEKRGTCMPSLLCWMASCVRQPGQTTAKFTATLLPVGGRQQLGPDGPRATSSVARPHAIVSWEFPSYKQ
jgi:hypothetical protein